MESPHRARARERGALVVATFAKPKDADGERPVQPPASQESFGVLKHARSSSNWKAVLDILNSIESSLSVTETAQYLLQAGHQIHQTYQQEHGDQARKHPLVKYFCVIMQPYHSVI